MELNCGMPTNSNRGGEGGEREREEEEKGTVDLFQGDCGEPQEV